MWLQLTMIALRAGIRDNFAMIVQNSFKSVKGRFIKSTKNQRKWTNDDRKS